MLGELKIINHSTSALLVLAIADKPSFRPRRCL